MKPSPGINAKAERLLLHGRVVVSCNQDGMSARVEGDHDTYRLRLAITGWMCPCPARGVCAHVVATELATGWTRR